MSRSYRKTPILGHCGCKSEKKDKRAANQAFRSATHTALRSINDLEATPLPLLREVSNIWTMGKDGKGYIGDLADKAYLAKLLRK